METDPATSLGDTIVAVLSQIPATEEWAVAYGGVLTLIISLIGIAVARCRRGRAAARAQTRAEDLLAADENRHARVADYKLIAMDVLRAVTVATAPERHQAALGALREAKPEGYEAWHTIHEMLLEIVDTRDQQRLNRARDDAVEANDRWASEQGGEDLWLATMQKLLAEGKKVAAGASRGEPSGCCRGRKRRKIAKHVARVATVKEELMPAVQMLRAVKEGSPPPVCESGWKSTLYAEEHYVERSAWERARAGVFPSGTAV